MLKLNNMVILDDCRSDISYIINKDKAKELRKEEGEVFTIRKDKVEKWQYIDNEKVDTGTIKHKFIDNKGFEVFVKENLWTSGVQQLSNLIIE